MNGTTNRNAARPGGEESPRQYRPSLRFYHANTKGTGCALQLDLHPAHDRVDGCIMARIANQMTIGDLRGPTPTYPRFDWENSITVKLDFTDLSKILQVLRGECESLEDGKGLYHRSPRANTRISLRHHVEPTQGYSFDVYRTPLSGEGETRAHIMLAPYEALGLMESIAGSMSVVSFGIPMVIAHDTSAYEAEVRERCNASAA